MTKYGVRQERFCWISLQFQSSCRKCILFCCWLAFTPSPPASPHPAWTPGTHSSAPHGQGVTVHFSDKESSLRLYLQILCSYHIIANSYNLLLYFKPVLCNTLLYYYKIPFSVNAMKIFLGTLLGLFLAIFLMRTTRYFQTPNLRSVFLIV